MRIDDKQVGAAIRLRREELGMSQADLAAKLRVEGWKWSQATVWSVEQGERPLRLTEAAEVSSNLGVNVDYLLGGQAEAHDPFRLGVVASIEALRKLLPEASGQG